MWYWGGGLYPDMGVAYLFSIYSGLLLLALAVGGAFSRPRGGRLVLSLCAVSGLLALGGHTPLLRFLYDHGFSSLRYPEKFLLLGVFAGVIFAAQALQRIVDGDEVARRGALGFAVAATSLAALLAIVSFFPVYSRVFLRVWDQTLDGRRAADGRAVAFRLAGGRAARRAPGRPARHCAHAAAGGVEGRGGRLPRRRPRATSPGRSTRACRAASSIRRRWSDAPSGSRRLPHLPPDRWRRRAGRGDGAALLPDRRRRLLGLAQRPLPDDARRLRAAHRDGARLRSDAPPADPRPARCDGGREELRGRRLVRTLPRLLQRLVPRRLPPVRSREGAHPGKLPGIAPGRLPGGDSLSALLLRRSDRDDPRPRGLRRQALRGELQPRRRLRRAPRLRPRARRGAAGRPRRRTVRRSTSSRSARASW